jgi:hypothetical protein
MDDQLVRLIAQMDNHFATDDASSADRDDWKALKRHIVRMMDGLALVETTLRMERELGRPFTEETARKVEGYARFGLGDPKARREE